MDAIRQMYEENIRKSFGGSLEDVTSDAPAVQPSRRTVEPQQPTVAPVRVVAAKPTPITPITPTYDAPVRDERIDELAARIARLEQIVRPALADKPTSEIDKIATEHAMLVERGKTELTYHEYRLMKRTARQALLQEAANA